MPALLTITTFTEAQPIVLFKPAHGSRGLIPTMLWNALEVNPLLRNYTDGATEYIRWSFRR